jgi:prepilin-type processing-associated H-X9-DG protein
MDAVPDPDQFFRRCQGGSRRRGLTVLELLVVIGVLGLLVGLLLPALMAARESARRTTCISNLRQIGLAMLHHHDRRERLPSSWQAATRAPYFAYGWAAQILPELEAGAVRRELNMAESPSHLADARECERLALPIFVCPSDITERTFELLEATDEQEHAMASIPTESAAVGDTPRRLLVGLPTANYLGVYGTVEADDFQEVRPPSGESYGDGSVVDDRRVRFADLSRGLSCTLLVGERTMATAPSTWLGVDLRGEDAACRLVGSAMTHPNCRDCDECEFTSRHSAGSLFLWADGHVKLVPESIEPFVYRELARRTARHAVNTRAAL